MAHRSPSVFSPLLRRRPVSRRRRPHATLAVDALEPRRLLAITPGAVVSSAFYTDADGDRVDIEVTGTVAAGAGFTVELAGGAADNADANRIQLLGLGAGNGLRIVVTPQQLATQPGTGFATLYSAGYTNVTFVTSDGAMTALGSLQYSAAIVHSTKLTGVAVGSLTLDAGQAPYADRINTQNANQSTGDSLMYKPVTGLIHLGGVVAASLDTLVIDGAISAPTGNPHDLTVTNDFRSVIEVDGRIGSIVGLRSNLRAAVHADSIGSIRVAAISGEITTRNSGEDLAINLPGSFSGFINSAGHLHLGFPMSSAALITGQIQALGISGNVKEDFRTDRYVDPLFIPGTFVNSITLTGNPAAPPAAYAAFPGAVGHFPVINVDGIAAFGLRTPFGDIADVNANGFAATFVAEADRGSVGDLDASQDGFAGHVRALGDIGSLRTVLEVAGSLISFGGDVGDVYSAVGGLTAFIRAEGSIGDITTAGPIIGGLLARTGDIGAITSLAGFLETPSIQAGGDIGPLSLYGGLLGTSIVAGGDLGTITVRAGNVELTGIRARNFSGIEIVDGSMESVSIVATGDIGDISAFGNLAGFGISNVAVTAAGDVGMITGRTHVGSGIELLKVEAGGAVAGIVGFSNGEFGSLGGAGILDSNFAAADFGTIEGVSVGGTGIESTTVTTFTARDGSGAIDRTRGTIGAVRGRGWLDGLLDVIVVAHTSIGAITGESIKDGSGITGGSYDANYGSIGPITAAGGSTAGSGIVSTRFQATDADVGGLGHGRIASIRADANAGGQGAMSDTTIHAGTIGQITATVHGGVEAGGISEGEIRAFWGGIDGIDVTVRSTQGVGIQDAIVTASGDIGGLSVLAFNNTAILGGQFQSRGDFGAIRAESQKGGNAIDGAIFTAPGRIFIAPAADSDPRGSFDSITAIAGGTDALSNAITGATFTAIGDIGPIVATSRGGGGIVQSIFTADSDGDYDPNAGASDPGATRGSIASVSAIAAGRNLAASSGIVDSTFNAAIIGDISADVQTVEGGDGILRSRFNAETAVYDGRGNYDNTGTIGDITVTNRSGAVDGGAGIFESRFTAGAAGAIGDITVTTNLGSGIFGSFFIADIPDLDQNLYTSTIGSITVTAGRVQTSTLVPVGITGSFFIAAAGIGDVTVDSVGAGITASVFTADFDWLAFTSLPGNLGNITVRVPGRSGSGVTGSAFFGSSIGDITVRLTDDAAQGINAVALSAFTATTGTIGNVTVIHSQSGFVYNVGLGYAILTSTFTAALGIGGITIQGRTLGAVFIVGGQPVVRVAQAGPAVRSVGPLNGGPSIGPITIAASGSMDLNFDVAGGSVGDISFVNAPAGAVFTLTVVATSIGNITVDAVGGLANASLDLTAQGVTAIGNVTVDGNATLRAAALQTLGNLSVGGMLTLPQNLANVAQIGSFTVGSLARSPRNVVIGSATRRSGTSIGAIRIGQANTGKGRYAFNFAAFAGRPSATVGSRSLNSVFRRAVAFGGVQLLQTAPNPQPTPARKR